jgi:predicted nucleotidyltransferase
MSDLVKRLHVFAGMRAMGDPTAFGQDAALLEEAAAEVERLRADPRLAFTGQDYCDLRNALANLDGISDTSDLDEKLRQAFIANRAEEVRDE